MLFAPRKSLRIIAILSITSFQSLQKGSIDRLGVRRRFGGSDRHNNNERYKDPIAGCPGNSNERGRRNLIPPWRPKLVGENVPEVARGERGE